MRVAPGEAPLLRGTRGKEKREAHLAAAGLRAAPAVGAERFKNGPLQH